MGLCPTKSSILLFPPGKVDRFLAANISLFILRGWVLVNLRWQILDIIGYVRDLNVVFCIEGRRHIRADFSSDWLTECWLPHWSWSANSIDLHLDFLLYQHTNTKDWSTEGCPYLNPDWGSAKYTPINTNVHALHTHFHIYSILSTNNMWYMYVCLYVCMYVIEII